MKMKINNYELFQNISQSFVIIWEANIIESTNLYQVFQFIQLKNYSSFWIWL